MTIPARRHPRVKAKPRHLPINVILAKAETQSRLTQWSTSLDCRRPSTGAAQRMLMEEL